MGEEGAKGMGEEGGEGDGGGRAVGNIEGEEDREEG